MKRVLRQWLAVLLSLSLLLTLLPAAALAEEAGGATGQTTAQEVQDLIDELPDAEEITADNRADVQAQIDAIDAAMLGLTGDEAAELDTTRYDAAVAALLALDAPSAVEQVQALIDALPDAEEITAETRADVQAQIDAIDAAMLELTGDEVAMLDTARYDAAAAALSALDAQTADPDPEPGTVEQVQALIDALPDAAEITADNRADVQAQIDAIDAAMLELTEDQTVALDTARYDAAAAALLALDAPSALEQVQALIEALPDADTITADNRTDVEAQLTAIDEAKQDLTDDELDTLDITRYMAAVEALLALDDMAGANEPETMDTEVNVSEQSVSINQDGDYTITGNTSSNTITVTGGTVTITLRGVSITSSGNSPIDIQSGKVTLILEGGTTNTFTSNNDNNAAIHVAENAYLTITGDGTLNATSKSKGAGIGGNYNSNAGHITIESGTITAKSNGDGAGIGGGHTDTNGKNGVFQSITISGGYVRGESASNGAGIGNGCWGKTLGTINISGGIIHAKTAAKASSKPSSGDRAFDIGYSHSGSQSGGSISITGGVIFTENRGIKNPSYSNCLVVPKSGDITVYGNPTIKEDFTIPSGRTLTVPNGRTLTVAPGATLTVASGATLTNNGTVQNNGRIVNNGTINGDIRGNSPVGYSISVTAIVFDSVQEGYEQPEAKPITIKNTGTEPVTISKVTVSGSDFTIINGSENTVAVGGSNTSWTIQPRSGLAAGEHTATITVTYDGGRSATTTVSFQVEKAHIKYLDANGREATCKVYTEVTGQTSTWNTGWYVVSGEQSISGWITVNGNVNLILTNDSVLTAKSNSQGDKGIVVTKGNSLTIYAQPPGTGSVGKISTAGSLYVAGIGGSSGSAGTITIHGGQITASGGGNASAIGSSYDYDLVKNGAIVITGGVVNAVNKGNSNHTGDIAYTSGDTNYDTFSTGTAGNAVIFADKIGDHSNETKWSGIIFEGDTGKIYGTPTPIFSFEIPSNKTLNVEKDHPLHIAKGVTMTNKGTINIGTGSDMNAVLNNEGTIINEGTIDVWGQLTHGEAGIKNQNGGKIVYHFNLDIKVPTFADAEYGYSQPPAQEITITNNGEVDATITDVKLEGDDFTLNNGNKTALTKGSSDKSWTIQPVEGLSVGTHTATITVTYSGNGGGTSRTATAEVTFTVTQATPTVNVNVSGDLIYGSDITLTAEVTATGVDPGEINDEVTFKAGTVPLGTAQAVNGTATLEIAADNRDLQHKLFGTNGQNVTVTAEYAGDSNIEGSRGTKTVTIKPKTLTFDFTAEERAYDQTTDVTGTFTLNVVVGSDDVNVSAYTAKMDNANAGDAKPVTASVTTLDGADAKYYTPGEVDGGTVNITQAELDLTVAAVSITYGDKLTDDLLRDSTAKIKGTEKSVEGSWAWDTAILNTMPAVSDSDSTHYKVVFTPSPEAPENFTEASLSKEITITVDKATPTVTVQAVTGTYGDDITITAQVTVPGVDASLVTGTIQFEDGGTLDTVSVENGTATLTVSGTDRDKQHALFGASGSSTVTAKYSGNDNIESKSNTGAATISQRTLKYTVTADGREYIKGSTEVTVHLTPADFIEGDNLTLTATGNLSAEDVDTYTSVKLTEIAIGGTDKAYYTVASTADNVTLTAPVAISQIKARVETAPTGATGLTYNGNPLGLLTSEGTPTGGTMQYYVGEKDSTEQPDEAADWKEGFSNITATDAGTYTIWYRANGNLDYATSDLGYITVTIAKAESSVTKEPAAKNGAYDGADHPLVEAGTAEGGTIQYSLEENGEYSEAIPNSQGADSYTVWYKVVGDANHNDSKPQSVTVTIDKGEGTGSVTMGNYLCMQTDVNPEPESDTNGIENVTYTYTVKGQDNYSNTKPTTAGEYTVKAVFAATDNYNEVTATADFTISHHFNEGWEEESDGYHHTCPCNTDVRLQETEFNEVPDGLKDNEALDTVDEITQVLVEEVKKGASISDSNTAVYDVKLQIKSGGSDWVDVTDENFPEDGITVILPYPEGTNSSYTFTVIHMITTGENAGQMEKLEPTNNEDGISFTVKSLSPICVGWTAPPSPSTGYHVTIPSDLEGGSVTSDRTSARQGSRVTLTVTPDEGYRLGSLTVTDTNGKPVELTDNGDGTYTFTMPRSRVTVEAEFIETAAPTVTVTVTEAPTYGSDITLTATVTSDSMEAAGITGTVQFKTGGKNLGGPVTVENGTATLTISATDAAGQKALFGEDGTSTVTAEYSGNDDIGPSTGTANITVAKRVLAYTVTAADKAYNGKPDIAVTLTPTNALPGDDVTLTATGNVEKADVGKYSTVDLSDIALSGDDAKYYAVEASKDGVALASPVSIIEGTGEAALHGTVTQDGKPVAGATVTLKQGDRTVSTATTGADGTYSFPNVAPGVYDIVVQTKDGKTMTVMVTITDETGTERELGLPVEDVNSVLDVQGMGTIVVVGGLDAVAKDHAVSGSTVTVTMTIKREIESTAGHAQAIKAVAGGRKLEYMEIGLEKTTETDGRSNTEALTTTRQLLTIVIGFDLTGKSNVAVYRYHGGNVDTLTETANGSGEYIKLDRTGGTITLHVKNFSTYAIGYTQEGQTPTPPDTPDTPDTPGTPGTPGTPSTPGTSGTPGSSGTPSYDITIPPRTEGGTVGSSQTTAQPGSDVTLTVTPDEGYHFDSLTVTDGDGKPVELTDNGDGTYTFTMPSGKVTVDAEFVRCVSLAFTDLDVKAWYHDYTDYVIAHGLMRGIGGGLFGPDGTVSRAQMVTVLWNMNDKPVVNYYMTYSDVSEDAWYTEAIRWAASEGIVDGYGNGKFGPNDTITREQMAVMLYRYEQKYGGGGFSGDWMYRLPFTDLDELSDWALEAVAWCNMKGIMSGKSDTIFDPKGPAKRSEMAAILTRYLTQDKRYLISSR